jgi:hypothetical protein
VLEAQLEKRALANREKRERRAAAAKARADQLRDISPGFDAVAEAKRLWRIAQKTETGLWARKYRMRPDIVEAWFRIQPSGHRIVIHRMGWDSGYSRFPRKRVSKKIPLEPIGAAHAVRNFIQDAAYREVMFPTSWRATRYPEGFQFGVWELVALSPASDDALAVALDQLLAGGKVDDSPWGRVLARKARARARRDAKERNSHGG